jgi:glycosyltransferase involved in cell wall biosynthesis
MRVVQNAVDIDRIDRIATKKQGPDPDLFTIATVGLIKMKNPFTVLHAFRQGHNKSSRLIYVGEGNLKPLLAREVKKTDLHEQVEMTGLIERDEVFEHFVRADLFVSASWGEGLPVAVLEAMACRRPVLLSDIPPHREIAEGADIIPLVEPHDVAGFAREIQRFAKMPSADRAVIGQECRKIIEKRFSLAAMHAGLAQVYAQITGKQVGSPLEPASSASSD